MLDPRAPDPDGCLRACCACALGADKFVGRFGISADYPISKHCWGEKGEAEYALQDRLSMRDIERSQPFEANFLPGRKIDMSIVFSRMQPTGNSCPGCKMESKSNGATATTCNGCGMWYQRIEEIVEQPISPNAAADDSTASITGKRKLEQSVAPEDNLSSFKRVRLLQRNYIVLPQLRSTTSTDPAVGNHKTEHPRGCPHCNESEALEWRKGPDDEKTLCNICGMRYAQLTRMDVTELQAAESESWYFDCDFDSDFATLKLAFSDENLAPVSTFLD